MNQGLGSTSHVAAPENIIVIDANLVDNAWKIANSAYFASNLLPSPHVADYFIIDLNLVSSTDPKVITGWLKFNAAYFSYEDSNNFIALGHDLTDLIYHTQIETAITAGLSFQINGSDLANLSSSFDRSNYPHYFQVETNALGVPTGITEITDYNCEANSFSFPLFKAIFTLFGIAPTDRRNATFSFAQIVSPTNVTSIGFKLEYGTKTMYYDFSGGQTPPLTSTISIARRLK
ncbi:hypothetical protein [Flavobacterium stagni]|uniref:Uncharacterized protein n=1 Tax=Flavobacterium stagni TaxID=2506421 RepID=A0A4Q1K3S6_9FLAO|nr:hypothetical protein [Flavobacterium stagni]RXR20207.1 hypothetical protein EQG61_13230 [Flavobacterium stagni]